MVPRMPPQEARLGFVYSAPYRIQGVSVAGEQAVVHVPEFDLAFDIGLCPRPVLAAPTVALSHAHMTTWRACRTGSASASSNRCPARPDAWFIRRWRSRSGA